jgi:murein DD-endopeptidase MepM/ murein hydrolase activator NlpD
MRERTLGERAGRAGRRLVWIAGLGVVVALVGLMLWSGTEAPAARIGQPIGVVGKSTRVGVKLTAGRTGLAHWEARLRDGAGHSVTVAQEDVPRGGLLGSGVRSRDVELTIEPEAAGLAEGPATLEIWANDHGWTSGWRGPQLVLEQSLTIDLTPPRVSALGGQHHVNLGGSDAVIYEATDDTEISGVQVGNYFFPGTPLAGTPAGTRVAVYAIPHDVPPEVVPVVVARDGAGNERIARFPVERKNRAFPSEEIDITDDFLGRKVPDLLRENKLPVPARLLDGYLVVNRDLRKTSEERLREITTDSAPEALFEQSFLQQPGSQVRSAFAESRTYRYGGDVVDRQTHLGYDLASLKNAPVAAANDGKVRFVGSLGIYGDAVVIDHGLGLSTLYAHLSSIQVGVGDIVKRGQPIGRTGETGLAGGDHLHFSVLLRGVHVDPIEWWDGRWIRHHLQDMIAEVRAETAAAAGAPAPSAAPGAATVAAPAQAVEGAKSAAPGAAAP